MIHFHVVIALATIGSWSCAAPHASTPARPADLSGMQEDITQTRKAIRDLDHRLEQLVTRISFESPTDEFTTMTIDAIGDAAMFSAFGGSDRSNAVLCHIAEWRGFGKMKRFTYLADKQFFLESEGHPTVIGNTGVGGISNEDGSTRYVILSLDRALDPGARYRLRPRNQNELYRWNVAGDVTVVGR